MTSPNMWRPATRAITGTNDGMCDYCFSALSVFSSLANQSLLETVGALDLRPPKRHYPLSLHNHHRLLTLALLRKMMVPGEAAMILLFLLTHKVCQPLLIATLYAHSSCGIMRNHSSATESTCLRPPHRDTSVPPTACSTNPVLLTVVLTLTTFSHHPLLS